jgi:hypothetical protein
MEQISEPDPAVRICVPLLRLFRVPINEQVDYRKFAVIAIDVVRYFFRMDIWHGFRFFAGGQGEHYHEKYRDM